MSEKYKIHNPEGLFFITITVIGWIDVFTRCEYKDCIIKNLQYCQKEKGLNLHAWCIMTNHIHLIASSSHPFKLENTVRDFKKFTSVQICRMIESNLKESRREWMLGIFRKAASMSKKHIKYQFWRASYHPVELSTAAMIDQRLAYIHFNPVKAGIVDDPQYYLYSSAMDYYAGRKGLLEVVLIE